MEEEEGLVEEMVGAAIAEDIIPTPEVEEKELTLDQQRINEVLFKTPKKINKIKSIVDKMDDITIHEDGRVVHNILKQ